MKKRITSAILAVCLALTLLPVNAWAADADDTSVTWGDSLHWSYDSEKKH